MPRKVKYQARQDFEAVRGEERFKVAAGAEVPEELSAGQIASMLSAGWIEEAGPATAAPAAKSTKKTSDD